MKKLLWFPLLILFVACNPQQNEPNDNQPNSNNEQPAEELPNEEKPIDEEPATAVINFADYFMPNNSIAYFEGIGNEFASYSLRTNWLNENYVVTILDNGGAVVQKVYRITQDKVALVLEELMDTSLEQATYPTIVQLDPLPEIEIYLQGPFEIGATFEKWKIIKTNATLETPYKQFNDIIIFEENGDNYINRHYFAKGYGEIKRESIMTLENAEGNSEQYTVTSTLKSIEINEK